MRHREFLAHLRRKAKAYGLVPWVPDDEPLRLESPASRQAFGDIMRKAGFTEAEIKARVAYLTSEVESKTAGKIDNGVTTVVTEKD